MRFLISVLLIGFSGWLMELHWPWWSIAITSCLVTLVMEKRPGWGFLAGFAGVSLLWLIVAVYYDVPNYHILSQKMAALFYMPSYILFIAATVFTGGLVGGVAGWSGSIIRKQF